MDKLLKSIIVLFLFYNVKYVFLFGVGTSYVLLFCFLLMFFLGRKVKFRKTEIGLVLLSLIVFSLSLTNSLVEMAYEIAYLKMYVIIVVCYLVAPVIYKFLAEGNPGRCLELFGYAAFLNSLFILAMFFIPSIKELYLNAVILELAELHGDSVFDSLMTLRMVGVTGFSGYSTAFTQMLCLISYYIYIIHFRESSILLKKDYAIFTFIIISSLIVSRSTIVGVFFLFLLSIFDRRNIGKNILYFSVVSLLFIGLIFSSSFFLSEKEYDFFSRWATEFFNSGLETGSLSENINMYKYSIYDFSFLGDARVRDESGGYYMHTDVGYFRLLFSFGFFGAFMLVGLIFLTLLFNSFRFGGLIYSLMIMLYISIFMAKGYVLQDALYIFIFFFIFSSEFRSKDYKLKEQLRYRV
ncbi:hypothetical protein ACNPKZ_00665 [Shewanella algae]|uniref:hypothetical protein n=1 Tax=Shewanella algae TaxID=38313 RepID=UPI003AAF11F1